MYHQITKEFFKLNFGASKPPYWYARKYEWITAIAELNTIRQSIHYEDTNPERFNSFRYEVSRKFKAPYHHIDICLGVCLLDASNPYGVLRDFLAGASTTIKRTTR